MIFKVSYMEEQGVCLALEWMHVALENDSFVK
jgi:hypothetical protein